MDKRRTYLMIAASLKVPDDLVLRGTYIEGVFRNAWSRGLLFMMGAIGATSLANVRGQAILLSAKPRGGRDV